MLLRGTRRTIAGPAPINAITTGWPLAGALIFKAVVRAKHRERLARARRAVGKDARVVAEQAAPHERLRRAGEDLLLRRVLVERVVEGVCLVLGLVQPQIVGIAIY